MLVREFSLETLVEAPSGDPGDVAACGLDHLHGVGLELRRELPPAASM
jgi:hypothetical protein